MKKRLISILITFILLSNLNIALPVTAYELQSGTCGDNLVWSFKNGILTISGTGDMENYSISEEWQSNADICKDVPWRSLYNDISHVVIKQGVTSIGDAAFSYIGLQSIEIADSVTKIGEEAFMFCERLNYIKLPDSVTEIGAGTFKYNNNLITIDLPNNLKFIGSAAFSSCFNLKNITIPEGLKSIGNNAFNGCESLVNIDIPNSVEIIGYCAFSGCKSLTDITLPNKLDTIEFGVFDGCTSLKSIVIPRKVKIIETGFVECNNLSNIYYEGSKSDWDKIYIDKIELIDGSYRNIFSDTINLNFNSISKEEISVVLNEKKIKFDQPPVMINDRVMVPIRAIFEAMGYNVNWDGDTQTTEAIKSTNKITVQINNSIIKYKINGKSGTYECDVAPQIISERILVPVRAIAESAGCDVKWDGENTTVIITYYENGSNQLVERNVKALLLAGYDDNEDANKKQNHLDANRLSVDYVERALNALNVYNIEKYYMENDNNYMSASQLSTLLSQIFKETTDDDLSIIYYSGHSLYYFDEHDNEKHITAFSNYTFEDFYNIIRKNVKGDVLLMYDGCYAGELMNLNNYDDRIKIIAACDEDDYSSSYYLSEIDTTSDENQICSIFAYALYNGAINNINYLDSNNDKTVTFDELYVYLLNSVYNICDRITTQEDKLNRLKDMLGLDSALRIAQIVQSYPNSDTTPLFTIK